MAMEKDTDRTRLVRMTLDMIITIVGVQGSSTRPPLAQPTRDGGYTMPGHNGTYYEMGD